jgi:hypothetical protein
MFYRSRQFSLSHREERYGWETPARVDVDCKPGTKKVKDKCGRVVRQL